MAPFHFFLVHYFHSIYLWSLENHDINFDAINLSHKIIDRMTNNKPVFHAQRKYTSNSQKRPIQTAERTQSLLPLRHQRCIYCTLLSKSIWINPSCHKVPFQNEVLDLLTQRIVWALGFLLLTHLASRACASLTSPSSPPPIGARGSVMQTTFCQIKFEWIGGMTTIPSEWICKGLIVPSWHTSLLQGAATRQSAHPAAAPHLAYHSGNISHSCSAFHT